ncbi:MAG: response regulator transcription factor [Nevskiaceae bacterium]|jgi:DNA-binding NarL/FixJ family response regulator|nr:response regulator transcription factor [Nevskiaceae bacterium]
MNARIVIVDDHPIVRQGLKLMINAEQDLSVVGEAKNEAEARDQVRDLKPDAVIVDLTLGDGDGFNVVRHLHAHYPETKVLVLSMHEESVYAERLLAEGASGYIMKQAVTDQLITALHTVLRGELYLSDTLQQRISARESGDGDLRRRLSVRELQVLSLIGDGQGTREIADALSLSVKTIESHRAAIKRKLGLETSAQLVQYAIKWHGLPAG